MYPLTPEWARYFQQLHQHLQVQTQQFQEMSKLIQQITKEVEQLKEKTAQPPVVRNEYRFDLFKVEQLSGTLSIGIKPDGSDSSSIEEFAVQQSMNVPTAEKEHPELYRNIQQEIKDYLQDDAYSALQVCENKYQHQLDDSYRKLIVEDVAKQIDNRIRYYLQHIKQKTLSPEQLTPEQFALIERQIVGDVKRDIDQTFEAFIKNLPKKGV